MPINSSFGSISRKGVSYTQGKSSFVSSSVGTFTGALATNLGNFSITVNRTYILLLAHDPTGAALPTITSVTNGQAVGTWTALSTAFTAPATTASGTGVITRAYIMKATATNATNSITVNFSAAPAKGARILLEVNNLTTATVNVPTVARGTNTGPGAGGAAFITLPARNSGDFTVGFVGWEQNNSTFTKATNESRATWSTPVGTATSGGSATANIAIGAMYMTSFDVKLNPVTVGEGFGLTNSASSNWSAQVITVKAS